MQVHPGHEDVLAHALGGVLRRDEPEPPRVDLQLPHDQLHPVGETVPVPPDPDQLASFDELHDPAPEPMTVLGRNRQNLHQLPDRGRMTDALANSLDDLAGGPHAGRADNLAHELTPRWTSCEGVIVTSEAGSGRSGSAQE